RSIGRDSRAADVAVWISRMGNLKVIARSEEVRPGERETVPQIVDAVQPERVALEICRTSELAEHAEVRVRLPVQPAVAGVRVVAKEHQGIRGAELKPVRIAARERCREMQVLSLAVALKHRHV